MTRDLVMLGAGFALCAVAQLLFAYFESRPRRFKIRRDYFDPCGPQCKAKLMSKIGLRERSEEVIDRIARRVHSRVS